MKKSLLLVASLVAAVSVYGQGQVTFDNFSGTVTPNYTTIVNGAAGEGASSNFLGADYTVGMFYEFGALTHFEFDVGTPILFTSFAYGLGTGAPTSSDNTTGAGLFAYVNPVDGSSTVIMPGITGTITIEARAWYDPTGSNTWAQALAAAVNTGESGVATVTLATGTALVPNFNPLVPAFVVGETPEPTTLALCGLGAASLLLFRRRKK